MLNLRDDEERQWLREYCESNADVVIQNMRPGKVETLGLDGPTLALKNPKADLFQSWGFWFRGS